MFLTEQDKLIQRMGSEITLLERIVEEQRSELEGRAKQIAELVEENKLFRSKVEVVSEDGHQ